VDRMRNRRIQYRELFADELLAVMPVRHRLARHAYLTARDFEPEHLLVYDAPRSDLSIFTEVLDPAGVVPREVSRVPLTEAILELVKAEMGVGVMARWVVAPYLAAHTLAARPITRPGLHRRWYAGFLKRKTVPTHLTDFIGFMAERAGPAVDRVGRRARSA